MYTYLDGTEYEDIAAAWDWNLIPGTTVDYNATPLTCDKARFTGLEAFVGGASNGGNGVAVMRYKNPYTQALSWQKAWFFLNDDVQHIMLNNISSSSGPPVYSVLDQRRYSGSIIADSEDLEQSRFSTQEGLDRVSLYGKTRSLWHGKVGYTFRSDCNQTLSLRADRREGNWSMIGISTQPPVSVDLFTAWIDHENATNAEYTAFPGVSVEEFQRKQTTTRITTLQNDDKVSGVFDELNEQAMIVFWGAGGGNVDVYTSLGRVTIRADKPIALIWDLKARNVTIADPSQLTESVEVSIGNKHIAFQLPSDGNAGASVTQTLYP
jgi:hypothetical protein